MPHARLSLFAIAVLGLTAPPIVGAQDFIGRIAKLRLTVGPYAGGFRLQENDARLNWYFANLGLLAACDERPDLVQPYLDLYLSKVDGRTGTIRDVADLETGALQRSDSDDSYAATFLSLATKYRGSPGGRRWWGRNRVKLKEIARLVLLDFQKPSGLVPSFANPDPQHRRVPHGQLRGLSRPGGPLAGAGGRSRPRREILRRGGGSREPRAIAGLFDEGGQSFRHADVGRGGYLLPPAGGAGLPRGLRASRWGTRLAPARDTRPPGGALNAGRVPGAPRDRWEEGEVLDGSLGGYPWMVLGYAAVKRGERGVARTQLASFARRSGLPDPPPPFTASRIGVGCEGCVPAQGAERPLIRRIPTPGFEAAPIGGTAGTIRCRGRPPTRGSAPSRGRDSLYGLHESSGQTHRSPGWGRRSPEGPSGFGAVSRKSPAVPPRSRRDRRR